MRLGIDIDGTVCRFVDGLAQLAWDVYHQKIDESKYGLGLTLDQNKELVDLMIDSGDYLHRDPYEGAAYTIQQWAKTHEIYYLTRRRPGYPCDKRDYHLRAQTYMWLRRHGFPSWANCLFSQDKARTCHERNIPVLIEDYLPDCEKHSGLMKGGGNFYAILIDRPWNQGEFPRRIIELHEAEAHFPKRG